MMGCAVEKEREIKIAGGERRESRPATLIKITRRTDHTLYARN